MPTQSENVLVTGGAGFIGSSLVDHLLERGNNVRVFDNLSTGNIKFLDSALKSSAFEFIEADCLDEKSLNSALEDIDVVYHLQANADIRWGLDRPTQDLRQNTIATSNLLEGMRSRNVKNLVFASTGAIYGDAEVKPTPENAPFPIQTSLYGASKLACEGLISAYCEGFGFQASVLRFASVLGERLTHGHLFDFYSKLTENPNELEILGDGNQRKTYVYVKDVVEAAIATREINTDSRRSYEVYNVATAETSTVRDSARWISEFLEIDPELKFSGGERGWVGDSPHIDLDCSKLRNTGWSTTLNIRESVFKTLVWISQNQWVIDERGTH